MATKLRLTRAGSKKVPYYKIIVADSRRSRDGKYIEQIGTYDPKQDPAAVKFEEERLVHWLNQGAQATLTVKQLIDRRKKASA